MESKFGAYRILRQIGSGGMGEVYSAEHEPLRRTVALSLMNPQLMGDPTALRRFEREFKLAAKIRHPNVVEIYDGGVLDDTPYIVMALVEGVPLNAVLAQEGPFSPIRAASIFRGVAAGLSALHEQGIIHRDIKPSNILLSPGDHPILIDFGLVRSVEGTEFTEASVMLGTMPYMAPELYELQTASTSSDMWAMGCVFFELLTARRVFPQSNLLRLSSAIRIDPISDPRAVIPGVPRELVVMLNRLLERDFDTRLESAHELVRRLDALLERQDDLLRESIPPEPMHFAPTPGRRPAPTVSVRSPDEREPPNRGIRQRTHVVTAAVIVSVCLLVVWAWEWWPAGPGPASPRPSPHVVGGLFERWRDVENSLAKNPNRSLGSHNYRSLRNLTAMDLGDDSRPWLFWVKLGHWLEMPDPQPSPPSSGIERPGQMTAQDAHDAVRLMAEWFRPETIRNPPAQLSCILRIIAAYPGAGPPWLGLGRFLDLDSRPRDAVACYRVALEARTLENLDVWPPFFWQGFAQATWVVPGRSPEQYWLRLFHDRQAPPGAFGCLTDVIKPPDPEFPRVREFLRRSSSHRQLRNAALLELGHVLEMENRKAERWEFLTQALKGPGALDPEYVDGIRLALVHWALVQGDVSAARQLGAASTNEEWIARWKMLSIWADYAEGILPSSLSSQQLQQDLESVPELRPFEVQRLIQLKRLPEAVREFHRIALLAGHSFHDFWVPVMSALDLLGAGSTDESIQEIARAAFFKPDQDFKVLDYAAGALSTPAGIPIFENWLQLKGRGAIAPAAAQILRGVWLGRCGLISESLAALPPSEIPRGRDQSAAYFESLSRIYCWDKLGLSSLGAAERVRLDRLHGCSFEPCWVALKAGRTDEVMKVCAMIQQDAPEYPGDTLSILMRAWMAGRHPDDPSLTSHLANLKCASRSLLRGTWLVDELQRFEEAVLANGRKGPKRTAGAGH